MKDIEERIQREIPLAPMTTIGIGGPARYYLRAEDADDVRAGVRWAADRRLALFVLAGGSNLLISDQGFDGLVLHIALRGITMEEQGGEVLLRAGAGESWDGVVDLAVRSGWAGIECLSGIPGLTGATPIQNVGAYGQEVAGTIALVEALDRTTGEVARFTGEECHFGYRSSRFKSDEKERYVILAVTFRLMPGGSATVRYPDLQTYLDEHGVKNADLPGVRQAVIAIRKRKGMVLDANDPDTRSDGSFFMNPIIPDAELGVFLRRARARSGDGPVPHFPAGNEVKLSAAWLIEHAGFTKGLVHGNVGLSSKHTLAVINRGGGTAREVLELVRMIQNEVRESFGVEMHPEPNFIGIRD